MILHSEYAMTLHTRRRASSRLEGTQDNRADMATETAAYRPVQGKKPKTPAMEQYSDYLIEYGTAREQVKRLWMQTYLPFGIGDFLTMTESRDMNPLKTKPMAGALAIFLIMAQIVLGAMHIYKPIDGVPFGTDPDQGGTNGAIWYVTSPTWFGMFLLWAAYSHLAWKKGCYCCMWVSLSILMFTFGIFLWIWATYQAETAPNGALRATGFVMSMAAILFYMAPFAYSENVAEYNARYIHWELVGAYMFDNDRQGLIDAMKKHKQTAAGAFDPADPAHVATPHNRPLVISITKEGGKKVRVALSAEQAALVAQT